MATTEQNFPNRYNRELILDLTLQAFSMYDVSHLEDEDAPRIHDYIPISNTLKETVQVDVFDEDGVIVTDGGANVTVDATISVNRTAEPRRESFKLLTTQGVNVTISEYKDFSFTDWISYDNTGFDFNSFLITGYNINGDFLRKKQAIYLVVDNLRTEEKYSLIDGEVALLRQSSCLVQSQWDFNDSITQGKWGQQFEAYRLFLPQPTAPASGDLLEYGPKVIRTKNKLRGSGDGLSLYFQSSTGKDMKLLGWGVLGYKVDEP